MTRVGGSIFARVAIAVALVACGTNSPEAPSQATPDAAARAPTPSPTATNPSGEAPRADAGAASDAAIDSTAAAACPPQSALVPGDSTQSITLGSLTRTFIVHVPPGYTGKSRVPLVFDFHPLTVSATTWKLATGWAGVADKHGFILVWPQGVGDSWNVGRCCGDAHEQGLDDVAFVRAMIAKLGGDACVDAKRIYATGCSNGGGMSYRLACDAADVVAAVAPVDFDCITGPTNSPSCAQCNPSRPISVAQFRGTSDSQVPYEGGPTSVVPGLEFPGAKANFADWAARNSCSGSPQTPAGRPLCETYGTCAAGTETTLCSLPLGVHCASYIPFGVADVAWEMLEKHAMP